ncbi:hypothetical protein AB0K60_02445 [Thermopolyspora sp. NPDC052614]|uniref:hypothetical protein n=1 Tax=Thermopolyspora sp. NPDC052614 TaxID=3155682 RepID=UPI003423865B
MREARAEDARTEARRLTLLLLGEEHPTAAELFRQGRAVLGPGRTAMCGRLAGGAPLTRRSAELAAIAALVVGTRDLGMRWWRDSREGKLPAPDEVLAANTAIDPWTDLTVLEMLATWIADDAADERWGRPVDTVDLNSWQAEDRIELPPDAWPGDRLLVAFDAGGRLDALVVERPGGRLGSNLDFASLRYSPPAEAQWSWGVAAGLGPHPLPDQPADPYLGPIDEEAADRLRAWALRHDAATAQVGPRWRNKGDVIAAIDRVDWMWRSGEWFGWWRAVCALVDGDAIQLAARLCDLDS